MPAPEVGSAIIKSSPVPLSLAEAHESLAMLTKLCPFFIRNIDVSGEEWLEMPSASGETDTEADVTPLASPSKSKAGGAVAILEPPSSPSKLKTSAKDESAEEVHTRSPRRVKVQYGGLREVRERIRRELEAAD